MISGHGIRLQERNMFFAGAVLSTVFTAWNPLISLIDSALRQAQNSHILLVLPIVLTLLILESKGRSFQVHWAAAIGVPIVLLAVVLASVSRACAAVLGKSDMLSLSILSLVVAWLGLIIAFYGFDVFRQFAFPLLFLLMLVPLPESMLSYVIYSLQYGSTLTTQAFFSLFGIPVVRDGFVLSLPTIDIEVASECSGIRSSMFLLLTTMVLGHLFLRTGWRQSALLLSAVVVTIFKNGLRIFTLSTLAIYIDPVWLQGDLHHRYGGSVFFALAIGSILFVLRCLRRSEQRYEHIGTGAALSTSAKAT
jgi:exosortase